MSQETLEGSFEVAAPARLKLSNISGSVDIQPGDEGVILVTAVKHLDSGDPKRTEIRMEQAEDGSVSVETYFNTGIWEFSRLSKPCKVDYVVRTPRGCSLRVSCVSSTTAIQGLEGDLKISSVSGSLSLSELSGDLKVNTVSGDVSGEMLSGPLRLETVSGDVHLNAANLPSVDGSTVSGDISIQTPLADGPYRFNSVSGDVQLVVPGDTRCTARLTSLSGNIRTSLPATRQRRNGARVVEIQGGGAKIHLSSVSGDLRIRLPEGETLVETPPIEPASTPRSNILESLERGEITVEEALKALRA